MYEQILRIEELKEALGNSQTGKWNGKKKMWKIKTGVSLPFLLSLLYHVILHQLKHHIFLYKKKI